MKRIDKNCTPSTIYKAWEENLEAMNAAHPKYTHSKTRDDHYLDIFMQLHYCQDGLCAYTEMWLCSKVHFSAENWSNGKYIAPKPNNNIFGQLEHFNSELKSKKKDITGKKDWLWDNLFVAHDKINNIKREKAVDVILKPDTEAYDPFTLLDYDISSHKYIPNKSLEKSDSERIRVMLNTLGVNFFSDIRRSYVEGKLKLFFLHNKNWENIFIEQFPTAFEMRKRKIEKRELTFEDIFNEDIVDKEKEPFKNIQ